MLKLEAFTDVTVYLPSEFETREDLDAILDAAARHGAAETSTIGPWAKWENVHSEYAIQAMRAALASKGIA